MEPRWLLIALSVICLLVLAPATALSGGRSAEAGCGTAHVDGRIGRDEWGAATRVAWVWSPGYGEAGYSSSLNPEEDASASDVILTGWLYLMNDQSNLYLAAHCNLDSVTMDPNWWSSGMEFLFTDEGNALDDQWDAIDCTVPPGEGVYYAAENPRTGLGVFDFARYSRATLCPPQEPNPPGISYAVAPGSMVWEWAVDLNASELDKVGPGDCFRFASHVWVKGCEEGSGCGADGNWVAARGMWPEEWRELDPTTYGKLCLHPCAVEFVPEPGSILLLGSGLAGLAGYATLRWRTRE